MAAPVLLALSLGALLPAHANDPRTSTNPGTGSRYDAGLCYDWLVGDQLRKPVPLQFAQDVYLNLGGHLSFLSETWDTLRYSGVKSFPLCTRFNDSSHSQHTFCLYTESCTASAVFPATTAINWHGREGDVTRLHAGTELVEVQFSYQPESVLHSHGIRVRTASYGASGFKEATGIIFSQIESAVNLGQSASQAAASMRVADLAQKRAVLEDVAPSAARAAGWCYDWLVDGQLKMPVPLQFVQDVYRRLGSHFDFLSETWDTLRYSGVKVFPLCTRFTDSSNRQRTFCLYDESCTASAVFPETTAIDWHGKEGDETRLAAGTELVEVQFSYQPESVFHSHGIRVRTASYGRSGWKESTGRLFYQIETAVNRGQSVSQTVASIQTPHFVFDLAQKGALLEDLPPSAAPPRPPRSGPSTHGCHWRKFLPHLSVEGRVLQEWCASHGIEDCLRALPENTAQQAMRAASQTRGGPPHASPLSPRAPSAEE